MVIIMQKGATEAQISSIQKYLSSRGIRVERMDGQQQTVFGIIGGSQGIDLSSLSSKEGVQDVIKVSSPYKHTSRIVHPEDTVITFPDGIKIGGNNPSVVIAGPCSVESEDQ